MSVVINPAYGRQSEPRQAAQPYGCAEVWDISGPGTRRGAPTVVRSIGPEGRNFGRGGEHASPCSENNGESFEPRDDSRESVLLGAALAVALLVGSAFGGVFSGNEDVPAAKVPYSAGVVDVAR